MNKIVNVIKLMAQTGLFFANVDGQYDSKEKEFIENFVASIEQVGDLEPELKADVTDSLNHTYELPAIIEADSLNHTYELPAIIEATKDLVDGFSDEERAAILGSIQSFIERVIAIDGEVHPAEEESFKQWKAAFGVA